MTTSHRTILTRWAGLIALAALASCATSTPDAAPAEPPAAAVPAAPAPAPPLARAAPRPAIERLAAAMTGTYDSVDQAAAARAPDDFRAIRLVMVPIWTTRTDGNWRYVEQAAMNDLDRPYRQRVYRVHQDAAGTLRSDVYTLPGDPLAFVGSWTRPEAFDEVRPEDLDLRVGCGIALEAQPDGQFIGGTEGEGCRSSFGDAAYSTSEVVIADDRLTSWDRGWTADGEQAWGPESRGYTFVRRTPGPPRR